VIRTRLHCTRATQPHGFRKRHLYFNTVFQHKTTERSQKIKPLCQQKSCDPYQALLYAYNTAVWLSTKAALFYRYFFNTKQPRGHKNKAALSTKMPRSVPGLIVRVQQRPYGFRQRRLYFTAVFQHKTTGRSQKNKATLSTKKTRSVPGLIVRVQHSRTAFEKGVFISTLFSTQNNREVKKIKPSFQQKSRDPYKA
jgi:hypothetical protein